MKKKRNKSQKKSNVMRQEDGQAPAPTKALVKPENATLSPSGMHTAEAEEHALQWFAQRMGVKDGKVTLGLIQQAAQSQTAWQGANTDDAIENAIARVSEMQPEDVTQAMLAVQMSAVHDSALVSLKRAAWSGTSGEPDSHFNRATRLMRLFAEQAAAMAKLKGKTSEQKVTVEHVHVHEGGQAIVGAVTAEPKIREGVSDDKRNKTP